jgi:hypothetical protein
MMKVDWYMQSHGVLQCINASGTDWQPAQRREILADRRPYSDTTFPVLFRLKLRPLSDIQSALVAKISIGDRNCNGVGSRGTFYQHSNSLESAVTSSLPRTLTGDIFLSRLCHTRLRHRMYLYVYHPTCRTHRTTARPRLREAFQ